MAKRKKKKSQSIKDVIAHLEEKLYEEFGEENGEYQEGYSDGIRALAKYVKLK